MINWIKKYWAELLVFGAIFGVLLVCCTPDFTWINTDCDGIHYTYAAKYMVPAHKTSAPLFLLLGRLFLWLPFGTEAWRIALISVLASMGSVTFIYLIIKNKLGEKGRLYALIGSLVFGGSALVISQSTIIESYALVTMFGLGAYYFAIKKNWLWCALMLGAGGAVHHLIGFPIIIFLIAFKDFRKWKYIGIMASFLLFYLYIPITTAINNPVNMWGNLTWETFMNDNLTSGAMLIGGLSIWDLPKRILDTIGVVGVSLGLAIIPIGYFLIKKQWYKEPLLWLFILPIIYYATNLAPQTYVYVIPAIGFGTILAGICLARMKPYWKWVVLTGAVGLLIFNANYFDIGRTLDPELSASKYYYEELDKVPDGGMLVAQQGWEWACVPMYNDENDRNIIPICVGTLPSPFYQGWLKENGVKLTSYPDEPLATKEILIARSIIEQNDDVWITQRTDAKTYGAEIIPADASLIELPTQEEVDEMIIGKWAWKPSNPYDIITGAIEVEEWVRVLLSNYSCLTFGMMGGSGAVVGWIGYMFIVKRKKWNFKRVISRKAEA